MTDAGEALRWIVDLLRELRVPYQIAGGLAARAWGSTRPLADIDIYVPGAFLIPLAERAGPHLVRAPSRHRDAHWNLVFMKVEYEGIPIELAGAEDAMWFDAYAEEWRPAAVDFDAGVEREIYGIPVPVMPLAALLEYKRGLDRAVDWDDVEALEALEDDD